MTDFSQPFTAPELMHDAGSDSRQLPGTNDSDTNTTTNTSVGTVVARIESILESIMHSLSEKQELSIDFTSRQGTRRNSSENRVERIRFPGRSLKEAKKFGMKYKRYGETGTNTNEHEYS